jgi:hypothetical protein
MNIICWFNKGCGYGWIKDCGCECIEQVDSILLKSNEKQKNKKWGFRKYIGKLFFRIYILIDYIF